MIEAWNEPEVKEPIVSYYATNIPIVVFTPPFIKIDQLFRGVRQQAEVKFVAEGIFASLVTKDGDTRNIVDSIRRYVLDKAYDKAVWKMPPPTTKNFSAIDRILSDKLFRAITEIRVSTKL